MHVSITVALQTFCTQWSKLWICSITWVNIKVPRRFATDSIWFWSYLRWVQQCEHYQRTLVSVTITLLNDSERSLNKKKWLRPVTNKSNSPHWLEIKVKHLPTFSLNCSISYILTKKHTSSFRKYNLKILHAKSLTKTHYCFGSHLGFSGDTPIGLNRERL